MSDERGVSWSGEPAKEPTRPEWPPQLRPALPFDESMKHPLSEMTRYGWSKEAVDYMDHLEAENGIWQSKAEDLLEENQRLREVLNEMKLCYVPPEFRDRIRAFLSEMKEKT
jgi:hypothetical protein